MSSTWRAFNIKDLLHQRPLPLDNIHGKLPTPEVFSVKKTCHRDFSSLRISTKDPIDQEYSPSGVSLITNPCQQSSSSRYKSIKDQAAPKIWLLRAPWRYATHETTWTSVITLKYSTTIANSRCWIWHQKLMLNTVKPMRRCKARGMRTCALVGSSMTETMSA